jgi:hypothetical protein
LLVQRISRVLNAANAKQLPVSVLGQGLLSTWRL